MYLYWPVILIGVSIIVLFNPLPILYHRSRHWWAYSNVCLPTFFGSMIHRAITSTRWMLANLGYSSGFYSLEFILSSSVTSFLATCTAHKHTPWAYASSPPPSLHQTKPSNRTSPSSSASMLTTGSNQANVTPRIHDCSVSFLPFPAYGELYNV